MTGTPYIATKQQAAIIARSGDAFITACPGAGKTRTMVERAKRLLASTDDRRGVAFLSFTSAAVEELEARLRAFGILPTPTFPSFTGTFDSFLWHFFIAPFGIPGCAKQPRLVPDKSSWKVEPFDGAQTLTLDCFSRTTGKVIPAAAASQGFDTATRSCTRYETAAASILSNALSEGLVDFDDVRVAVAERLADTAFADRLGAAMNGRFREVVVDEAQDCNPADLEVVAWLRRSGIPVNVICDPNQSIYEFRGGVTDELRKFADTFVVNDQLKMTGNFRSSPAICSAIVRLRAPTDRESADEPLGPNKDNKQPVHILSYAGTSVPATIGAAFGKLASDLSLDLIDCPVVAATRATAFNAVGQPAPKPTAHMTLLLAEAVTAFHFSFALGDRRNALARLHRVVLLIQGHLSGEQGYHSYLNNAGLTRGEWRPSIIALAKTLRHESSETSDEWLARARSLLGSTLLPGSTINQRLRSPSDWGATLTLPPDKAPPARTIHSVKGMEFPGVCVVMTTRTAKGILDFLEGSGGAEFEESARKLYVAASRAERLLAIASPKSQASRLEKHLQAGTTATLVHAI